MDRDALIAELKRDEGLRLQIYDDATGLPLKPGMTIVGHPTIGYGRALDLHGISEREAYEMVQNDIDEVLNALEFRFSWFNKINNVRQRVLCNMAFNMGINSLLGFSTMLKCVGDSDYTGAAVAMEDSVWFRQVGDRAKRLVAMMQTGTV